MVISVNRNSGIFDKKVADELNKSFNAINQKIADYKAEDLEYKEDTQLLGTNTNSFRSGHLICIRDKFEITEPYTEFTKVGKILVSVPYDVWTTGVTPNNEAVFVHIKGQDVYIYGTVSYYPQYAYVSQDIVVPKV